MPILSAYVFPHPPLAVPAVGRGQENMIADTLAALDAASREIASFAPETIIFLSPHGTVYGDYFHISPGKGAKGDLSRFGARGERFEIRHDVMLTEAVNEAAGQAGIPAGTLGGRDADIDHGVTVPMWFINRHCRDYGAMRISPSGLGRAEHYRLGQCIAAAAEQTGRRAVVVASGDLSHKLSAEAPYGHAPEGAAFDAEIMRIFRAGDFLSLLTMDEVLRERAAECGYTPFLILAGCFDRQAVTSRLLSYEGPFGVGYAVACVTPDGIDEGRDFLGQYEEKILGGALASKQGEDAYQALARRSLEYTVLGGSGILPLADALHGLPDELTGRRAGAFVTLHKEGRLRGCIGTIAPVTASLAEEIVRNAVSAGVHDDRFVPVTAAELPHLVYKVDVLGEPERIDHVGQLDVERYGVIVTAGRKRGLLLPNLDGIDTVEEQVAIARRKGGIGEDEGVTLERFEVVRHESRV